LAIEDITNLRRAQAVLARQEAWFRNMADNAPVSIWVTGRDKLLTFMNTTGLKYRGITLKEAIGRNWADGAHPDDYDNCLKIYEESFEKRQRFELRYRLQKYDAGYKMMIAMGNPDFDANGDFTGFIGSCTEEIPDNTPAAA